MYEEVPPDVPWDHPDNRLILATGPLAGLPVWGTGGLTVVTRGAMTNGGTSTQANGFFGANLKYSGYDAIVFQGQASGWVYLYIKNDIVELRDAAQLLGKDTWEMQDTLNAEHGLSGHQMSVYGIGPAGENLVRFAVIAGDYGHVASKNGCGAVMGKKKVKAVCIVRGSRGIRAADVRGLYQAADEIAYDLKTDPSTRSLYEYGTLPGVVNLLGLARCPSRTTPPMKSPKGPTCRFGRPRLCATASIIADTSAAPAACTTAMQVPPSGPYQGKIVDEPEYEGWSGSGWAIGLTDRVAASWLNTQIDRAGVDVNEFGWLIGWVMECMEKGTSPKSSWAVWRCVGVMQKQPTNCCN